MTSDLRTVKFLQMGTKCQMLKKATNLRLESLAFERSNEPPIPNHTFFPMSKDYLALDCYNISNYNHRY